MGRSVVASQTSGNSELVLWTDVVDGVRAYEMLINGVFIMASYNRLSSELLVRHPITSMAAETKILVGGLGMGYTVREACSYQKVRRVDVVELEPVVIDWNKTWFKELNSSCLEDERVRVIQDDFFNYVKTCPVKYDLICMDIDNGPMLLVNEFNSRVYRAQFFRQIKKILNPQGVFAIWSCNYDADLLQETRQVFAICRVEEAIENHADSEISYFLYFCKAE